jgi:hypothetical protein
MEIKYINSPLTFSQFSPTLAQNLVGSVVTVLPQTTVNFAAAPPSQDPNAGIGWIPFVAPFVFSGPNLVTQVRGNMTSANNQPLVVDNYVQQAPTQHYSVGRSCGGSLVASHDGTNFVLFAQGVPSGNPVTFLIGRENVVLGNTRLPIDLSPIGMTGCELGLAPELYVPVTANAFGTATLTLKAPIPEESAVVHAQALHPTTTNASGLALTNTTASVLGNSGLCNFVFSIDGVTAISGPLPFNNGSTLLLR